MAAHERLCKNCQVIFTGKHCAVCNKASKDKWRKNNAEKIQSWAKTYYVENKEKINAVSIAWAKANPEVGRRNQKEFRDKNPELAKKLLQEWRSKNGHITRIHSQNRRARKIANGGTVSRNIVAKLMFSQCGKCAICRQSLDGDFHLDHIVPLALGGHHSDTNLQLAHSSCNSQKGMKDPVDFMQSKGYLL